MKLAFVPDLHPEKGFNEDMFKHIRGLRKTYDAIYLIGDCAEYPSSYKKLKDHWISGNHDDDSGVDHIAIQQGGYGKILCIHGHQWDPDCQDKASWMDQIAAWLEHTIDAQEFSLAGKNLRNALVTSTAPKFDPAKHKGCEDEPKLCYEWYKEHDSTAQVIVYGHKHSQFTFVMPNGVRVINCGAGWRGQYVTLEANNEFYFNWFK